MKYDITLNGKKYIVDVDSTKATIDIVKNIESQEEDELTELDVPDFDFSQKDENTSFVQSPLPGTVVSILVEKGESVSKGQCLMILESMKMENEILSPMDGIVSDCMVSLGANVKKDQEMLALKKE